MTEGRGSNGREVSNERWHLATQPTPAHERRKVSRGLQNGNSTITAQTGLTLMV